MSLKRYLTNLANALAGHNPYKIELDLIRLDYHRMIDQDRLTDQMLSRTEEAKEKAETQVKDYQRLTESLRGHLAEKETQMEEQKRLYADAVNTMRKQHSVKVSLLEEKLNGVQDDLNATLEQLQKANSIIGKDIMAQSLLDKTNNGLEDLVWAMQRGNMEAVLELTQGLDWNHHLTRIAQQYLNVLRRKNELESRLYEKRFDVEGIAENP